MNALNSIFYAAAILPIAWVCFLALRPFVSGQNRLLFVVIGMSIYGFFMKAVVVPLTDVQAAHVLAREELSRTDALSNLPGSTEVNIELMLYIGVTLVLSALLTLWLQRALAASPKLARFKN